MRRLAPLVRLLAIVAILVANVYAVGASANLECWDCKTCLANGVKVACYPEGTKYSSCAALAYNPTTKKPRCMITECGGIGGEVEVDGEDDLPDPPDPGGFF